VMLITGSSGRFRWCIVAKYLAGGCGEFLAELLEISLWHSTLRLGAVMYGFLRV